MTMLVSIFGMAGRFAGDLLTSALGWASNLMYGRVPRKHQVLVVLMMALSFLWLLALLVVLLPALGSVLLATTPHPASVDQALIGGILLACVLGLPLAVGVAGSRVPTAGSRPEGFAIGGEILRGYLLAPVLSGLLLFLAGVGIVRKVRSWRHGWSDVHVPIVVKPRGYEQLVRDIQDALAAVGLEVVAWDAPWVLTMPGRILAAVSGRNLARFHQDRLIELRSTTLRIGIYPSDIAISGTARDRTRARAAILSRLATAAAHLTTSSEAQSFEDRLAEVAESRAGRSHAPRTIAAAFEEIDADLLGLTVQTAEWDILYRLRLQLERDLLLGRPAGTVAPGDEGATGRSRTAA